MQRGMVSPEVGFNIHVVEFNAEITETGEHPLATLNHLCYGRLTHRAHAEHLAFQVVLPTDDLGVVFVLQRRSTSAMRVWFKPLLNTLLAMKWWWPSVLPKPAGKRTTRGPPRNAEG